MAYTGGCDMMADTVDYMALQETYPRCDVTTGVGWVEVDDAYAEALADLLVVWRCLITTFDAKRATYANEAKLLFKDKDNSKS